MKMVWIGGERVLGTHCEDAPCCGCCSDDPAYQPESDPHDFYDEDDFDPDEEDE